MKKRVLSVLLAIVMVVGLFPVTAGATTAEPVKTWEIGASESGKDAVVAKLYTNATDNTKYDLVISGTGEMGWTSGTSMPWTNSSSYQEHIVSVTVESGVTNVESRAFKGCTALTSVTLGDTVTEIGGNAFKGCTSLTAYTVDSENTTYSATDGILFSKDGKTLVSYPSNKNGDSYTVPDSVTKISSNAFCYVTNLKKLTIPHTTTTIGAGIFYEKVVNEKITIKGHTGSAAETYTEGDTESTTFVSICSDGDDADTLCDVCGYDPAHAAHPVCGATCTHDTDAAQEGTQPHSTVTYTAWDGTGTPSGNVYLTKDITLTQALTISGTVNLCLNGHKVSTEGGYFDVADTGTLNLCSCEDNGIIKRTTTTNALISADAGATANLYNVTLDGGAVWGGAMDSVLERGTTNSSRITSSAPLIDAGGQRTAGGHITLNSSVILQNNECSDAGDGGAITLGEDGTLVINGATICNNAKTDGNAGAIKAYAGAQITFNSGEIYGNSAYKHGGAFQIFGGDSTDYATTVFTMNGGIIRNNKANGVGGGVAVSNYSQFIMNGGSIIENATTESQKRGGGVGFADANTAMSISGNAVISGNVAGINANNLYIGDNDCNKLSVETMGSNANVGVTMSSPGVFSSGGASYAAQFNSDNAAYKVATDGSNLKLVALHTHNYTYSATGNIITESCTCGHEETATVSGPTGTIVYDGTEKKGATVSYSTGWLGGTLTVTYQNNINAGQATASITKAGATASVKFTINKAKPDYTSPMGVTATYGDTLEDIKISAWGSGWSWKEPTTNVGDVGTKTFVAVFTPADTNNYNTVEAEVSVKVNAKQLTNPTIELSQDSFAYDGSAKTPTVTVKDGDTVLTEGTDYTVNYSDNTNAGTGKVTVTFTGNYSGSAEKNFTISKADQKDFAITDEPIVDIAYGGSFTLGTNGGNGEGAVSWSVTTGSQYAEIDESGKVTVKGVGEVTITATKAESTNYKTATDTYTFTSVKATPTYTIPANLTATYGQTLANVSLTNGWSWVNDSQSVGAVGTKSFDATFTPSDTVNYKTVEVKLTVTVGKATPVVAAPTAQNSITYGAKLSEVGLTDGWAWVDGNTVPTVQNSGYVAYYTPADTDNFDWTGIYGWSTTNNRVERKVSVTVAKADSSCTDPVAINNLVYTGSAQNLVTAATPTGGTVQYSLSEMGTFSDRIPTGTDAGTYDVYYKVIGDANHNDTAVLGPVQVKIAKQKVTMPTENTATFTYTGTAQTYMGTASTLYEISNETQTNAGSYTVFVALKDPANYEWTDGTTAVLEYTFKIEQKEIGISWSNTALTYNGAAQQPTATATGVVTGEQIALLLSTPETNAGSYTAMVQGIDGETAQNYKLPTNKSTSFTIEQQALTILWGNGTFTYDSTEKFPVFNVEGIWNADDVQVTKEGAQTNAGEYTAEISGLTGTAADNYKLTGTLAKAFVINKAEQAAPAVNKADETISGKDDGKITDVTSAMEYRKDGTDTYTNIVGVEIAGLVDGTYYVRLKGDSNHNPSSDTKVVIAAGQYLKVTFNSNGGSDINAITGLTYNTVIAEPTAPTKDKANFAGWFSDSACTKAWNFDTDTVTADLTLYAKWSDVPVFHISGTVLEKTGDGEKETGGVPNANVKLMLGTTLVATETTDENGLFYFGGQKAGDYNVVVTSGDKVVTVLVTLHDHDEDGLTVELPQTVTNSIVKHVPAADGKDSVAAGTLVGGLEDVAAAVRSENENQSAQKVEVKLTVADQPPVTGTPTAGTEAAKQQAQQKAIQQKAGGKQLVFFDLSVVKTINNGAPVTITDTGATLLEIRIPFDSGNKWGITIYRYHDDKAEVLAAVREGSTTEGFWVGDDGYIHIYTHNFSTYAVGYTVPSYGYFVPITPDTVTSADTFDAGIVVYVTMSMLAATGSAVVIGKKRKEEN